MADGVFSFLMTKVTMEGVLVPGPIQIFKEEKISHKRKGEAYLGLHFCISKFAAVFLAQTSQYWWQLLLISHISTMMMMMMMMNFL